jgi:site-specific DNA-methyltransferase (adenine-specific)
MFAGGENFTHNGYDANSGNASRYFYCAKANPSERNAGCDRLEEKSVCINESHNSKGLEERYNMKSKNPHPTVKPVELMEYLVKLITPKGGTVLDPFMGSG